MKNSNLRMCSYVAVFIIVAIGLIFHTGFGTPSSFGIARIAAICPLGYLETLLASKELIPPALVCFALVVLLIVLFGKAFCGWLCPVPLVRRVFAGKKFANKDVSDAKDDNKSLHSCKACSHSCQTTHKDLKSQLTNLKLKTSMFDSRFSVLIAALLSALIVGVPVFCLICPVGLSIASFIGIWRLIQFNELSWMLVVFPTLLILELFVLKKWCHRFCPISALLSIISKANKTFQPKVDTQVCLRTREDSSNPKCHNCYLVCPEAINLHDLAASVPITECTRCKKCQDVCPSKAITFKIV